VLARGWRYEELAEQGNCHRKPHQDDPHGNEGTVINRLEPQDLYEYILVIVRKNQVPDLLPVLAQNRSPNIVS